MLVSCALFGNNEMQHETLTLQKEPRAKRLYGRLGGISNQGMHIVQLAHPEGEVG